MRVRLKTNITIPEKDRGRFEAWIEPGKQYVVLEVGGSSLRLHDGSEESDDHGLWEAQFFDVTDSAVPRNWSIDIDEQGHVSLAPRRWFEPDFWSAYYDGEPAEDLTWARRTQRHQEARSIYEAELKLILTDSV